MYIYATKLNSHNQYIIMLPMFILVLLIIIHFNNIYLQSGYLVVPEEVNANCWMLLFQIAEYMCLSSLMALCEN